MAVFPSFKLTKKGEELLNRCIGEGKVLTFTKIKIGNGVPVQDWRELTDIQSSFKEFPVLETSVQKDQVLRIKAYFDNKGFLEDKKFKEIGVFVKLEGLEGEFLYSYTNAGDTGDIIPSESRGFFSRTLDIANYIGYATNITFNIEQTRNDYDFNTEAEVKVATFLKAGDRIRLWGRLAQGDIQVRHGIVTSSSTSLTIDNGLFVQLTGEIVVNTIEDLKNLKGTIEGTVVEVLGYYEKGDGAGHKRKISKADDGSGVQLANNLWANVVFESDNINPFFLGLRDNNCDAKLNEILTKYSVQNRDNKKVVDFNGITLHLNSPLVVPEGIILTNFSIISNSDTNIIEITNVDSEVYCRYAEAKNNLNSFVYVRNKNSLNARSNSIVSLGICKGKTITTTETVSGVFCKSAIEIEQKQGDKGIWGVVIKDTNFVDGVYDFFINCHTSDVANWSTYTKIQNVNMSDRSWCQKAYVAVYGGHEFDTPLQHDIKINRVECFLEGVTAQCRSNSFTNISNKTKYLYYISNGAVIKDSSTVFFDAIDTRVEKEIFIEGNSFTNIVENTYASSVGRTGIFSELEQSRLDSFFSINAYNISPSGLGGSMLLELFRIKVPNRAKTTKKSGVCSVCFEMPRTSSDWNNIKVYLELAFEGSGVVTEGEYNSVALKSISCKIKDFGNRYAESRDGILLYKEDEGYIKIYQKILYGYFNEDIYKITKYAPAILSNVIQGDFVTNTTQLITQHHSTKENSVQRKILIDSASVSFLEIPFMKLTQQPSTIVELNTPYHVEKMKQEGVYNNFVAYMDEKTAYDNQQREKEKAMQLAYEEALKENPDLTYEEFISTKPTTFRHKRSIEMQEPVPSQALLAFKEKYLG